MNATHSDAHRSEHVPKICGADVELGNFVLGGGEHETAGAAARAVLSEFGGVSPPAPVPVGSTCACAACTVARAARAVAPPSGGAIGDPQDWGRQFLTENGGCAYIDLDHLELCLPEVRSATDHVACWHAMLRLARRAQERANAGRPAKRPIHLLVNNRDGYGRSYGAHLNVLVTRRAWNNIFHRRMQFLLSLAACQVSSIVFTGQGKVGSENGRPDTGFQISQRADFMETLVGPQTTYNRPIVNSRDEPSCGRDSALARFHAIFFDNTLCHVASLLKVGVMQIVLAMIEAERVSHALALHDPLDALVLWSRDMTLTAEARLVNGQCTTAVALQRRFLDDAADFAASGALDGIVPGWPDLLALWDDTLTRLAARDFAALAPRLDWVLKWSLLERARETRGGLDWQAPEIRHLDHAYSSLGDGLYWACESAGAVERVVSDETIDRFTREPPSDTRAWMRAHLLRSIDPRDLRGIDWDAVDVVRRDRHGGSATVRIELPDPADHGREAKVTGVTTATIDGALEDIREGLADNANARAVRRRSRSGA